MGLASTFLSNPFRQRAISQKMESDRILNTLSAAKYLISTNGNPRAILLFSSAIDADEYS